MRKILCLCLAILVASCGNPAVEEPEDSFDTLSPVNLLEDIPEAKPKSRYAIAACKATIGALMGRDPKTMKGQLLKPDIVGVSYRRPSDSTLWKSECMLDDANHLTWAAIEGDSQGRWRDEDQVTFEIVANKIHVRVIENGELAADETYPLKGL